MVYDFGLKIGVEDEREYKQFRARARRTSVVDHVTCKSEREVWLFAIGAILDQ